MKKSLTIILIIVSLMLVPGAWACGFKPFKPFKPYGCGTQVAICFCDANGQNCRWVWVCQ